MQGNIDFLNSGSCALLQTHNTTFSNFIKFFFSHHSHFTRDILAGSLSWTETDQTNMGAVPVYIILVCQYSNWNRYVTYPLVKVCLRARWRCPLLIWSSLNTVRSPLPEMCSTLHWKIFCAQHSLFTRDTVTNRARLTFFECCSSIPTCLIVSMFFTMGNQEFPRGFS